MVRCAGEPDSGEPHTRPPALPPTPLCFSSSCLCADLVRLVSSSSSPTKCAAEQNGSLLHSHPQLPHNHRRPPLNVASQPGRQAFSARALSRVRVCYSVANQSTYQTPQNPTTTTTMTTRDQVHHRPTNRPTDDDDDDDENNNEEEPGGRSMPSCSIIEYLHSRQLSSSLCL